jgi:hypothetical protein
VRGSFRWGAFFCGAFTSQFGSFSPNPRTSGEPCKAGVDEVTSCCSPINFTISYSLGSKNGSPGRPMANPGVNRRKRDAGDLAIDKCS